MAMVYLLEIKNTQDGHHLRLVLTLKLKQSLNLTQPRCCTDTPTDLNFSAKVTEKPRTVASSRMIEQLPFIENEH